MFKRIVTAAPRVGSVAPRAFTPLAGLQSVQAQPAVQRVAPAFAAPIQRRGYHEKVLDHYNNPRNVGSFKKGDQDVGTGLVGAPACGDVMKLQIRVNKESGKIDDVVFKTFGCGSAIASSSYLTELVRGMTLEEAGKIKNTDVAKELYAIKSAIHDYQKKNPNVRSTDLSGTGASIPDVKVDMGSPAAAI
ncbi:unnamed protein product [Penicillium manginii]